MPGASGSIALEWRALGRELLITVPADPSKDAVYYGDDGLGGHKQKGTLDTAQPNRALAGWLAG